MLPDSGPAGNVAQTGLNWTSPGPVAGKIGEAWRFNGTTDYVFAENVSSADSSFTISAWYANVDLQDEGMIAFQALSGFWKLGFRRTAGNPFASISTGVGATSWYPSLEDDLPHHYVWTLDAANDEVRFFLDGVERETRAVPPSGTAYAGESIQGRVGIAGPVFFNSLDLTDGVVDEFHIVEGLRDPDWILTEYRNQSDPAAFFIQGSLEKLSVVGVNPPTSTSPAPSRVLVWPNPFQGRATIQVVGEASDVSIYDVAGRLVRTLPLSPGATNVQLQWDGRDDRGDTVGSGTYFVHAVSDRQSVRTKVLLLR
jgi:hypothetical protein